MSRFYAVGIAVFMVLLVVLPAAAQQPSTGSSVEIAGIVEAIAGRLITVNGQIVDTAGAELNVLPQIGQPIKVEGVISTSGRIVAREVNAVGDDDDDIGDFEIVGIVESFDGATLRVAGQLIDVTGAEIYAGVEVGALVEVHLFLTPDGGWSIREVTPTVGLGEDDDSADDDLSGFRTAEFIGVIEAIDGATITVNGQVINITGAEIVGVLEVGAPIKVEAVIDINGQLVAYEVKPAEDDDDFGFGQTEITGVVEAIDGTTITIGGQTFDISNAEIYAGVTVGAVVEIKIITAPDGTQTVREIEPNQFDDDDRSEFGEDFKIIGKLEEIGEGYIVVSGQRIDTNTAEFDDNPVIGGLVEIEVINSENGLVATEVGYSDVYSDDDDDLDDDDNSGSGSDDDDNGGSDDDTANWTTYTIQPGDTLSSIAIRSDSSVDELSSANNITNPGSILVGTVIIVPNPVAPRDDDDDDNGGSSGSSGSGSIDDDNDFDNDDDNGSSGSGGDDDNGGSDDDNGGGDDDNGGGDDD